MQNLLESSSNVSAQSKTGFPSLYYENYTFYVIDSQKFSNKGGINGCDMDAKDGQEFNIKAKRDMLINDQTQVSNYNSSVSESRACLSPVYEETRDGSRVCSDSESIPDGLTWYRSSVLDMLVQGMSDKLLATVEVSKIGLGWVKQRLDHQQNDETLPLLRQHSWESGVTEQQNRTKKLLYYLSIFIGLLMLLIVFSIKYEYVHLQMVK